MNNKIQTGSEWNLPYPEFYKLLLYKVEFDDDVKWEEYYDVDGNIVIRRLLAQHDKDRIWDEIFSNEKKAEIYKYTCEGELYEKHIYIYSKTNGSLLKIEVFDGKNNLIRIIS
jgi:hypothetical protein